MTELARIDVGQPARTRFADEVVQTIRQTVASGLTDAEADLFLELAGRYGLNPLAGEIWAAKMPGRNGESGRFTPMVGRDGFLAIANRHPDYEGMDFDVVRANDRFEKNADGTFTHTYVMGIDEGGEVRKRGEIVGAYCVVHRRGRRPTPFFAPWHEYSSRNRAWNTNPTAMILKCAESNALRLAFNLSGLYSDAEMDRVVTDSRSTTELEPDYGDDELGEKLREMVETINRARPGELKPAKVRMMLAHATDDERVALADTLDRRIAEINAEADAEVSDAVVVEEPAA